MKDEARAGAVELAAAVCLASFGGPFQSLYKITQNKNLLDLEDS